MKCNNLLAVNPSLRCQEESTKFFLAYDGGAGANYLINSCEQCAQYLNIKRMEITEEEFHAYQPVIQVMEG